MAAVAAPPPLPFFLKSLPGSPPQVSAFSTQLRSSGVPPFFHVPLPPLALSGAPRFVLNVVVKKEEGQHQEALKFFEESPR